MINRTRLLADLKPLLKAMESDLRARCDEVDKINAGLKEEYDEARAADRTGVTFEEWRADLITQVAVAWVLSCVFVRFLEDNELIEPPRISGPLHDHGSGGLGRARDERETYFRSHPKQTDRDYLVSVFDDLAKLPGTKDVFGSHNLALSVAYRNWLSGDAAQKLIEFFQKIDADGTGEIVHDFTDAAWDTRFLGDLYQDLSEAARKKYALLQTPVFVEEFILQRTLEPAIAEFGLKDFKMIDPACGSGHFLLGSFARILKHWRAKEPGTSDRELVNRALASVYGVDLNPYAVAIARFRLLLAAMRECGITRLAEGLDFKFNLACGDSLLHGVPGGEQQVLGFHALAHAYQSEDLPELHHILRPGMYHAVVANPPYITVKDRALNQAYRGRYPDVCHMKYSLSVPFMQRLFTLACPGGYTGQITANSFMKREFGKKLVENYLPKIDLTHVIDTHDAHIPEHDTPTVMLFGRSRKPSLPTIRLLMGVKGDPAEPVDPATAPVWQAILAQIDRAGSESEFISAVDKDRVFFGRHPWSIGGGGASELKQHLDEESDCHLVSLATEIGPPSFAGVDEMFFAPRSALARDGVPCSMIRTLCRGELVRDWNVDSSEVALVPYDSLQNLLPLDANAWWGRRLWPFRTCSEGMISFDRKTRKELGEIWWSWYRWIPDRYRQPASIVFAEVATHNHFVKDEGGLVFTQTSPVIKAAPALSPHDQFRLVAILNSSISCFWMKQVCFPKGTVTADISNDKGKPEGNRFAFSSTAISKLPIPNASNPQLRLLTQYGQWAATRGRALSQVTPSAVIRDWAFNAGRGRRLHQRLQDSESLHNTLRRELVYLQEEIDWLCYEAFGLLQMEHTWPSEPTVYEVDAGDRPFHWPSDSPPATVPAPLQAIYKARREAILTSANLRLVEAPMYKRPWLGRQGVYGTATRSYGELRSSALRSFLTGTLESYFDFDGRMNDAKDATARGDLYEPRLTSVAKVADLARADKDFMQVAEIFTGRMDFDVGALVGELVAAESMPALPVLRYKPAAQDKRAAWERTWDLQRIEDAIDALFDVTKLSAVSGQQTAGAKLTADGPDAGSVKAIISRLSSLGRTAEECKLIADKLTAESLSAAGYVAEAAKQKLDLTADTFLKPVQEAAKRAKKAAVGDIPVPPKYTSADFLNSAYWKLRGKLDVPKERWVSFPHCEGEDGTLVIAWAGYDHLQLARAIAERYELAKGQEGRKLVPLLAAIGQLIPWLKQWHNDLDPAFGTRMGDYFEGYLAEEAKELDMTVEQVMTWTPPEKPKGRGRKKK